jgi:hypothetical protein
VKVTEREKPIAVEPLTQEEPFVIPRLNQLLDQFKKFPPPAITTFSFHGPVEKLLALLRQYGPDGLPEDGDALVAWLKVPANAKRVRESEILISFPPWQGKTMIRVERAASADEYQAVNR